MYAIQSCLWIFETNYLQSWVEKYQESLFELLLIIFPSPESRLNDIRLRYFKLSLLLDWNKKICCTNMSGHGQKWITGGSEQMIKDEIDCNSRSPCSTHTIHGIMHHVDPAFLCQNLKHGHERMRKVFYIMSRDFFPTQH